MMHGQKNINLHMLYFERTKEWNKY